MKRTFSILLAALIIVYCGWTMAGDAPPRPELQSFQFFIVNTPIGPGMFLPLDEAMKWSENFERLKKHIETLEKLLGGPNYIPVPWPDDETQKPKTES